MRLGLSSFLKGGLLMSGYKIIKIILGILSVMISFGALVAPTRLTIYLYYRDKDIYRQMEINLININLINSN